MIDFHPVALAALRQIACGHKENMRPRPGRDAQEIARRALIECGLDWTPRGVAHAEAAEVAE